jgi:hypothetical protein
MQSAYLRAPIARRRAQALCRDLPHSAVRIGRTFGRTCPRFAVWSGERRSWRRHRLSCAETLQPVALDRMDEVTLVIGGMRPREHRAVSIRRLPAPGRSVWTTYGFSRWEQRHSPLRVHWRSSRVRRSPRPSLDRGLTAVPIAMRVNPPTGLTRTRKLARLPAQSLMPPT